MEHKFTPLWMAMNSDKYIQYNYWELIEEVRKIMESESNKGHYSVRLNDHYYRDMPLSYYFESSEDFQDGNKIRHYYTHLGFNFEPIGNIIYLSW